MACSVNLVKTSHVEHCKVRRYTVFNISGVTTLIPNFVYMFSSTVLCPKILVKVARYIYIYMIDINDPVQHLSSRKPTYIR